MRLVPVLVHYVWWHYTMAIADLARNYSNILGFLNNFFSIGFLLRNLVAPWRRLGEKYQGGFDPQQFFASLIVNILMRLVGLIIRLGVIAAGVIVILLSMAGFLLAVLVWLALPLIVVFLLILGIRFLIA